MNCRCSAALLALTGMLAQGPNWAQSAPTSSAKPAVRPDTYVDRVIDASTLPPMAEEGETASYDGQGLPRILRIEARGAVLTQGDLRKQESAINLSARVETLNYGALSADGTLRTRPDRDALFILTQRGMPFEGGWRANNSLGMLNTPAIDLARSQLRFFLPSFGLAGAATEWLRSEGLQWHASAGQGGRFENQIAPGFGRLHGQAITAGAQWAPAPGWQAGAQLADVHDLRGVSEPDWLQPAKSARSAFTALAWANKTTRLQANVVQSRRDDSGVARGIWFDGTSRNARTLQTFGVFRLAPGLSWAHLPINNDIKGGYYRVAHHNRSWLWDAGVDSVRSISGLGSSGTQASASLRYRISQYWATGSGMSIRHTDDNAWSGYIFVDRRGLYGDSRVQFDATADTGRRTRQISLDHHWRLGVGSRLAASLGLGHEERGGQGLRLASVALAGGQDLTARMRFDASLRLHHANGNTERSGRHINLALVQQINHNWAVAANYYEARGKERAANIIDPLIAAPPTVDLPASRAMMLVLRFEERAGTRRAPLDGKPGTGAGNIVGHLYLDANENGQWDAGEAVAAHVTILLDNKFPVRTDIQGRFEFSLVTAGPHVLTVVPDNLPLPWTVEGTAGRQIIVRLRETTTIEIGASRIK